MLLEASAKAVEITGHAAQPGLGLLLIQHLLGLLDDGAELDEEIAVLSAELERPIGELRRDVNRVVEIAVGLFEREVHRQLIPQPREQIDNGLRLRRNGPSVAERL